MIPHRTRVLLVRFFYLLAAASLAIGIVCSTQADVRAAECAVYYVFAVLMAVVGEVVRRRPLAASSAPVYPVHPVIHPRRRPATRPDPDAAAHRRLTPIAAVRDLAGPAPRQFGRDVERYLAITPPAWLKANRADELSRNFRHQARIRRDGPIVWAAIVQANTPPARATPPRLSSIAPTRGSTSTQMTWSSSHTSSSTSRAPTRPTPPPQPSPASSRPN